MAVTVDYTQLDLTDDGAAFGAELITQFQNTQTDLGKMSEKTADETISGKKTHTGELIRSKAFYSAYSTTTTALADQGSFTDITWNVTDRIDSALYVVYSSTEIEFQVAGDYRIFYDGTCRLTGATVTRIGVDWRISKKPSGGSYSELAGTLRSGYVRLVGDNTTTTNFSGRVFTFAVGDRIKLQGGGNGSDNSNNELLQVNGGTSIMIEKV